MEQFWQAVDMVGLFLSEVMVPDCGQEGRVGIDVEWLDYDVVVVGSGGAGSAAAGAASESGARVLVVSKDPIGCSDTKISEGSATVRQSSSDKDTVEVLSENLRVSGADLPLQTITDTYARDSRGAYDWYRKHGLRPKINVDRNGPYARPLAKGGHTVGRSVGHVNAGVAFSHASWNVLIGSDRIDYLEDAWFLDLVTCHASEATRPRVVGGLVYDAAGGRLLAIRTPSVVIAAGGLSTLYFPKTDTMRGNTGDSYAVAARAGADLVDMEQVQFFPFCVASPPSYEGLLIGDTSTASFLGVLRDRQGKVILDSVYVRTRAECSAAIMRAVAGGRGTEAGGAFLDLSANVRLEKSGPLFLRLIETQQQTGYQNVRQALGKAAAKCEEPWEVRPAAHYMMGGIRADTDGQSVGGAGDGSPETGLAGLYAAGQAMGGVFGANRLGTTALTENAVFGLRAGRAAARNAGEQVSVNTDEQFQSRIDAVKSCFGREGADSAARLRQQLQVAAWEHIGPARTLDGLHRMEVVISEIEARLGDISIPGYALWNQSFIEYQELLNLLDVARAVTVASLERDVSVGGHVRLDRPNISMMAKPYSTVVSRRHDGAGPVYHVRREARVRTPVARLLLFRLREQLRKLQVKALRLLPNAMLDRYLERRYRTILGPAVPAGRTVRNNFGAKTAENPGQ
ncbi:MAG: FAD-binding protein [Rhodospirillales bacterium]